MHPKINRIFRADTPHDVLCACIVAETLSEGNDVLLLSADKSLGDQREYLLSMNTIASLHKWSRTVDISGLPLNRHWLRHDAQISRWKRLKDTSLSMNFLRSHIAPAFEIKPSDAGIKSFLNNQVAEVYLTCFNHPDIQALYAVCQGAKKIYYPHGLDSLHALEVHCYDSFCAPRSRHEIQLGERLRDFGKRSILGSDAVPVRNLPIDASYSFNLEAPWCKELHSLSHWLTKERMGELFERLDPCVKSYYRSLSSQCKGKTVVLLLSTADFDSKFPYELELDGYADLVKYMIDEEGAESVLIKPHPRNSLDWIQRSRERIAKKLPNINLVIADTHNCYPIEVVLSPFNIVACGGVGSSSLRTLRKIYGIRSYCPEDLILRLFSHLPARLETMKVWLADHRDELTPIRTGPLAGSR